MSVKTTLSFTERHHGFLLAKVKEGIFATQSAAVAAAIEMALSALAEEIRARARTPRSEFVDRERTFSSSRATIDRYQVAARRAASRLAKQYSATGQGS